MIRVGGNGIGIGMGGIDYAVPGLLLLLYQYLHLLAVFELMEVQSYFCGGVI